MLNNVKISVYRLRQARQETETMERTINDVERYFTPPNSTRPRPTQLQE